MANIIISRENISSFNRRTKKAINKILNQDVPLNVAEQLFSFALSSRDPFELKQLLEQKNGQFYETEETGVQALETVKKASNVGFNFEEEAQSFLNLFEDFFKERKALHNSRLKSIHFSSDGLEYGLVFDINSKFSKKMSKNGVFVDFSSNSPALILQEIEENRLLGELNIGDETGLVIEHLKTWLKYQAKLLDPGEFAFLMTRIGKLCGFYEYIDRNAQEGRKMLYNYREKSQFLRACLWKNSSNFFQTSSKFVGMDVVSLGDLFSKDSSRAKVTKAKEVFQDVFYLVDVQNYEDLVASHQENFKESADGIHTVLVNAKNKFNFEIYYTWQEVCKKLTPGKIALHGYIMDDSLSKSLKKNVEDINGLTINAMFDYSLCVGKNNVVLLKSVRFKYEEAFTGDNTITRFEGAKASQSLLKNEEGLYETPFNPYGINEVEHILWNEGYLSAQMKRMYR